MSDGHECIMPRGVFDATLYECDHCHKFYYKATGRQQAWVLIDRVTAEIFLEKLKNLLREFF